MTARHLALFALLAAILPLAALLGPVLVRSAPWIEGEVRAAGVAVVGARVRVPASRRHTLTDHRGRFGIVARPGERLTAAAAGFFIAGVTVNGPVASLHLESLPTADHEDYAWVDPTPRTGTQQCGTCHVANWDEWSRSGHARSVTGRHFRDLYAGVNARGEPAGWGLRTEHPDGAGVCAACHAPALPVGDPARFDLRQVQGVASRGVHCDFCHKIADVGDGELGLSHGAFNLRLLRPAKGQLFFGPLDDVDRGHDVYAPLYRESRYCASCHEGTVFGVPVYTTWSEWLASPARQRGQQCQDCHMKPTGSLANLAPGRGGRERDPATLANHLFFEGSQEAMLRRALDMSLSLARTAEGWQALIRLDAPGAGHRVPTGFVDRHLVLEVAAGDERGEPIEPSAGPRLPAAAGDRAGRPGRLFAKLLTDAVGQSPAPFWRPIARLDDTRLTPEQPDVVVFQYPRGVREVRAVLRYRRFWQSVARAKNWPDEEVLVLDKRATIPVAGSP